MMNTKGLKGQRRFWAPFGEDCPTGSKLPLLLVTSGHQRSTAVSTESFRAFTGLACWHRRSHYAASMRALAFFTLACLCAGTATVTAADDSRQRERDQMVDEQIAARDITHGPTLAAMRKVPRHRFVPESLARSAYADSPLPIGHGQTISQPLIVAFMTEKAQIARDSRVLEIGTGSGYQAAIAAELSDHVYSI